MTIETVEVLPAAGALVRDPVTRIALPTDRPTRVPLNIYWTRRIAAGDVTVTAAPQPAPATEPKPTVPRRKPAHAVPPTTPAE